MRGTFDAGTTLAELAAWARTQGEAGAFYFVQVRPRTPPGPPAHVVH
jgi:hypothetical protein